MTTPDQYTAAMAADPSTAPQTLADIAAQRPDLRAAVASNPATYEGLLDWLKGLGDPAVDAAIAARAAAPAVPVAPAAPQAPSHPTATYPAPGAPAAAPGQAPNGAPASAYGAPAAAYGAPASAYAGGTTPPPSGGRKKWPWILGIVLLVLVGLGVGAFFLIRSLFGSIAEYGEYGSDDALDRLYDQCADGDMAACDELYMSSPFGSDYEEFGDTCGNRQAAGESFCDVDAFAPSDNEDVTSGGTYGSDPALDALWDSCAGGDMAACDTLYMESPLGSEYEQFGDTCGGTQAGGAYCDVTAEEPAVTGSGTYGSDPALDALWDACEGGDMVACDDLYKSSALGSDYETFADTCGGRQETGTNDWCASDSSWTTTPDSYGSDAALDALWDACEGGDMAACDNLFMDSPIDSEYETFGDTCGGRQEAGTDLWCEG